MRKGRGKNSPEERRQLLEEARKKAGGYTNINFKALEGPRKPPTQKLFTRLKALKPWEFKQYYGETDHIIEVLFQYHWPNGFQCPVCTSSNYSITRTRWTIECRQCKKYFSLRDKTPLKNSKLSLDRWFEGYYHWCRSRGKALKFSGLGNPYKGKRPTDVQRMLLPDTLAKRLDVALITARTLLKSFANDIFWEELKVRSLHYKQVIERSSFARGGPVKTWEFESWKHYSG